MMSSAYQIITIDGPAGAGKSTVAKELAKILKFSYLDTGAMYRALTLKAIQKNVDLENEEALAELARQTRINLEDNAHGIKVYLDNQDVSPDIRSLKVTNNTFYIASSPKVREIMVSWQREIGHRKNIVAEGRDLGTVVFPQAAFKFYLDAQPKERCRRRANELKQKGIDVKEDRLLLEMSDRDQRDQTRRAGPLKKASDAVYIDSTHLSVEEVIAEILQYVHKKT